jgi:hypothetical protein
MSLQTKDKSFKFACIKTKYITIQNEHDIPNLYEQKK